MATVPAALRQRIEGLTLIDKRETIQGAARALNTFVQTELRDSGLKPAQTEVGRQKGYTKERVLQDTLRLLSEIEDDPSIAETSVGGTDSEEEDDPFAGGVFPGEERPPSPISVVGDSDDEFASASDGSEPDWFQSEQARANKEVEAEEFCHEHRMQ